MMTMQHRLPSALYGTTKASPCTQTTAQITPGTLIVIYIYEQFQKWNSCVINGIHRERFMKWCFFFSLNGQFAFLLGKLKIPFLDISEI